MPSMDILPLLEVLLLARGPGGQEDEVREICLKELAKHCDEAFVDGAGNVRGLIKATEGGFAGIAHQGHGSP